MRGWARCGGCRAAGEDIMAMPRVAFVRAIMLNHWYHHRGQLLVYLRLLNLPCRLCTVRRPTRIRSWVEKGSGSQARRGIPLGAGWSPSRACPARPSITSNHTAGRPRRPAIPCPCLPSSNRRFQMRRTITACALVHALCLGGVLVLAHTQESAGKIPITTSSAEARELYLEGTRPCGETTGHRRPPLLRAGGRQGQELRARLRRPGQHRADDPGVHRRCRARLGAGGQRERRGAPLDLWPRRRA